MTAITPGKEVKILLHSQSCRSILLGATHRPTHQPSIQLQTATAIHSLPLFSQGSLFCNTTRLTASVPHQNRCPYSPHLGMLSSHIYICTMRSTDRLSNVLDKAYHDTLLNACASHSRSAAQRHGFFRCPLMAIYQFGSFVVSPIYLTFSEAAFSSKNVVALLTIGKPAQPELTFLLRVAMPSNAMF